MTTLVDERGRILVPKGLRVQYGLEAGAPVIVEADADGIRLRRAIPRREALDTFLAVEALVEALTGGIATEAARLLLAHQGTGIGGRDAALLVTAKRRGATLLTHDEALAKAAEGMGLAVGDPAG